MRVYIQVKRREGEREKERYNLEKKREDFESCCVVLKYNKPRYVSLKKKRKSEIKYCLF